MAGLAVARLDQGTDGASPLPGRPTSRTPQPSSPASPTSSSTSAARPGWPRDVGLVPGTVWVVTRDGVSSVDVASGLVRHLDVEVDRAEPALTPLSTGVLVASGTGGPQLLGVAGAGGTRPLGPARTAGVWLPGPRGTVWVRDGRRAESGTTWVQADEGRATGPRVAVHGTALADGAGGLLEARDGMVRHLYPGRALDLGRARVLAVGPDGYVLDRCGDGTCSAELHRTDGSVDPVLTEAAPNPQPDRSQVAPGSVAPGDRYLVETLPTEVGDQVRVSRVSSVAQVLRTFPSGNRRSSSVWLSDRWLLAVSEDHLVLYDAATDTLVTPDLGLDEPTQVAFVPA